MNINKGQLLSPVYSYGSESPVTEKWNELLWAICQDREELREKLSQAETALEQARTLGPVCITDDVLWNAQCAKHQLDIQERKMNNITKANLKAKKYKAIAHELEIKLAEVRQQVELLKSQLNNMVQ